MGWHKNAYKLTQVPEAAPLHVVTPNSIGGEEEEPSETGSLISYKWRQLDSTSGSQQNESGVKIVKSFLQPFLLLN